MIKNWQLSKIIFPRKLFDMIIIFWHERWFRKRVTGKLTCPLFSLLFYRKERCYGSEILNACMSYQKKVIYGKKSVTRPPLHIALCYNSRWNGPISNFFSFWATERLFISKWGRISPESDWCWFKLDFGSSSLLLRGPTDLSLGPINCMSKMASIFNKMEVWDTFFLHLTMKFLDSKNLSSMILLPHSAQLKISAQLTIWKV